MAGIQFTETMRGFFSTRVKEGFEKGYDRGNADDSKVEFTLTVTVDQVDKLIELQSNLCGGKKIFSVCKGGQMA